MKWANVFDSMSHKLAIEEALQDFQDEKLCIKKDKLQKTFGAMADAQRKIMAEELALRRERKAQEARRRRIDALVRQFAALLLARIGRNLTCPEPEPEPLIEDTASPSSIIPDTGAALLQLFHSDDHATMVDTSAMQQPHADATTGLSHVLEPPDPDYRPSGATDAAEPQQGDITDTEPAMHAQPSSFYESDVHSDDDSPTSPVPHLPGEATPPGMVRSRARSQGGTPQNPYTRVKARFMEIESIAPKLGETRHRRTRSSSQEPLRGSVSAHVLVDQLETTPPEMTVTRFVTRRPRQSMDMSQASDDGEDDVYTEPCEYYIMGAWSAWGNGEGGERAESRGRRRSVASGRVRTGAAAPPSPPPPAGARYVGAGIRGSAIFEPGASGPASRATSPAGRRRSQAAETPIARAMTAPSAELQAAARSAPRFNPCSWGWESCNPALSQLMLYGSGRSGHMGGSLSMRGSMEMPAQSHSRATTARSGYLRLRSTDLSHSLHHTPDPHTSPASHILTQVMQNIEADRVLSDTKHGQAAMAASQSSQSTRPPMRRGGDVALLVRALADGETARSSTGPRASGVRPHTSGPCVPRAGLVRSAIQRRTADAAVPAPPPADFAVVGAHASHPATTSSPALSPAPTTPPTNPPTAAPTSLSSTLPMLPALPSAAQRGVRARTPSLPTYTKHGPRSSPCASVDDPAQAGFAPLIVAKPVSCVRSGEAPVAGLTGNTGTTDMTFTRLA